MRRSSKIAIVVVCLLIGLPGAGIAYLFLAFPKVGPADDLKVESTSERIARGRYLANNVAVCIDCHSTRDWSYYAAPILAGTEGKGGERFGPELGFPGEIFASNITPAALQHWSDGELARAITEGVSRDGRPYFPIMNYPNYASLCSEDLQSIIAYIRTLKPIQSEVPARKLNFPVNILVRTMPKEATPGSCTDPSDQVQYGKYVTTLAGCIDCHTQQKNGERIAGMEYAGGAEFPLPGAVARSSNITPDQETGIGTWDADQFVARFQALTPEDARASQVQPGDVNTIMPWTMYSGMTEQDLRAIFAYLRTLRPVKNKVVTFTRN